MARTLADVRHDLLDDPIAKDAYREQVRIVRLGQLLRRARRARSMSQENMAKLSGIDQGDLSRIENGEGERGPTLETLVKYAHALDLDLLVALTDKPARADSARARGDQSTSVGVAPLDELEAPKIFAWETF